MKGSHRVWLLLAVGLGSRGGAAQDIVVIRAGDVLRAVQAPGLLPAGAARVRRVTADSVWLRVRPYGETFGFEARDVTPIEVRRHRRGVWRRRLVWTGVGLGVGSALGAFIVHRGRCRQPPPEPGRISLACDTPEATVSIGALVGAGVGGGLGATGHFAWERPRWIPGTLPEYP